MGIVGSYSHEPARRCRTRIEGAPPVIFDSWCGPRGRFPLAPVHLGRELWWALLFQHFFAQLPFGMFLMGNISQSCDGSHNLAGQIVDRARVEDEVAATPAQVDQTALFTVRVLPSQGSHKGPVFRCNVSSIDI